MHFNRHSKLALFLLGAVPCLLFALFTDHAWEDWYITYRAGKNLAMGNGLVFEPGQILHTFTSPINALLPAALSWLLGNDNDAAVLWLYRIICAALLGGTVLQLHRLAQREHLDRRTLYFLIAMFVIDGKIMDFSINGQEAAFLVFFLALTLNALLEKNPLQLGIAWAGLMWSRPDSFIYIGITAFAYTLTILAADRKQLAILSKLFFKAGLLTVLLYGPWILWTFWYYGTPLPHTIVAKGLGIHHSPADLLTGLIRFPRDAWFQLSTVPSLFMPSYYLFGGWPQWMTGAAKVLAWLAAMAWLLPKISPLTRICSLGVFTGLFYLSHIASFPYPWYFPAVMLLAIITLAGLLQALSVYFSRNISAQQILTGVSIIIIVVCTSVTLMTSWQMRVQQQVIENSNRKQMGLWLKTNARSQNDTVFLECLGYIGFYSNLKMYDYPGMSSPEMVAARRLYGDDWLLLIKHLEPDWLVLRTHEARALYARDPALLTDKYKAMMKFDQSEKLQTYWFLPGRAYLQYDQTFLIFRRQRSTE